MLGLLLLPGAAQAQAPACPCTIFDPADGPVGSATQDQPLEVGVKFRSDEAGYITGLRFFKQSNNTGTHVGHLWTATGQKLAEIEFTSETASGWQEELLPEPIPITANTTYVASYHSPNGFFGFNPGAFSLGAHRPPLHALPDGQDGGNGVYKYGPSGFPTDTFNSTNYWVDVVFDRTLPIDTRRPTVASVTPAAGATGVPASTRPTATFDEDMDPTSINVGSFTLKDSDGQQVAATVSYDGPARKATLTPTEPLKFGQTYTATVHSGSTGVADVAGNKIAADKAWTFTTPAQCPCNLFTSGQAPADADATRDQALEVGVKFRATEDGYITHLRFYKQANNTGSHVGHLWSGTGQLLASAPFTHETASGWQQVELPNAVAVTKDTTYIASYHSPNGYFARDVGFWGSGIDRPPLRGLASGVDGGNGVYHYGASAFPTDSFNATNYWVDATFDRTIPPDVRGPVVTDTTPAANAVDVATTTAVTAAFDEALDPASVTGSSFKLTDADGNAVGATASYDAQTKTAKVTPNAALGYSSTYTATLKSGATGVKDVAGNSITADRVWSFTTAAKSPGEGPGGPILIASSAGDPFSRYYAEILRAEGLNAFEVSDGPLTAEKLTGKNVVVLTAQSLTDPEVTLLQSWVQGGGNLIAMRPDKKLAGLLGLTDAGSTLSNAYVKVDNGTAAGAGIEGQTLQFHGTADRYTLNGASAVANLYSDAATATSNPAVSLRAVGTGGGEAAAFSYDLARSVVYTRQGNPAWAGQKRDGTLNGIRAIDLFYGAKAGDVQPDWVDLSKIEVPQADEQQRLLANLITEMSLDKAPMPRFWYLPRGEKAALILTGDDHAKGGTPAYFDRLKASSEPGCSVADWECVRATSYVYPDTAVSDVQAAAYQADGFEFALHVNTSCQDWTPTSLDGMLAGQLATFAAIWPSVRKPRTNRTHCIVWSDWASEPKLEKAHGVRFDTNYYYHGAPGWLTKPGLLTGGGFPQRFADLDGSLIDVYQSMTQVTDESPISNPFQVETLLDNALGPKGYYLVLNALAHSDHGDHPNLNQIVAAAQERNVPIVTSAQMLDWVDGRNDSSFAGIDYSGGRLSFTLEANANARGLEAMLPASSASGPLARLTRNGTPVAHNPRTVKGVDYVVFRAAAGDYVATYATDNSPPDISAVSATADAAGRATVKWETDEPASSRVRYGRSTNLGSEAFDSARVTEHEVELRGLSPDTTYYFRVESADVAQNTAESPAAALPPTSFRTPPGGLVDTRTSDFAAGTAAGTYVGASLDGIDGELQLQPALGEEFEGLLPPTGWSTQPWFVGGNVTVSGGALVADGASAFPPTLEEGPRVLEFSASFKPVNDQGVGFSNDLSDFPFAAFTTGNGGDPLQLYATTSSDGPASEHKTPLAGISLTATHRFRIEWGPTSVTYFVDGLQVAAHNATFTRLMRPVVSDYQAFGAGVRVHWLRQGSYASSGTFTSRSLDSGPGAPNWTTLTATGPLPSGTTRTFQTRTGATRVPDASWSPWQAVGQGGAIASPPGRFVQYRATLTSPNGFATPTLDRVEIGFGAGTDAAPQPGSVTIAPSSPKTNETLTATPSGFSDADGDPLTYHYQWLRNGTPIAGATAASLDLSQAGNGDRGDTVRVEVYASDGKGASSDEVSNSVTVANTAPTAGSVTVKPATPSTNDVLKAVPSGFADADNDTLTYRYQWFRNGTAISGSTGKTLDLSQPGNGDLNDRIDVDVYAVDTGGGQSTTVRGGETVTGTNSTPVEGTASISPSSPTTTQTLTATPSGFHDPDGDSLTYSYRWRRNGTPIAGGTAATLDLSQAGNGDRGDSVRVEIRASDGQGATSDEAIDTVTVVNSAPSAGTVSVKPSAPASDDIVSAVVSGFGDADGDALTYQYQWFRNGNAISGATGRTLDLSQPGNGDLNDRIEVDLSALDGNGGTSSTARGGQTITSTSSNPVASYGFEEALGTTALDQTGPNDGNISGATRSNAGRFGRALSFDAVDDIVEVNDDPTLDLTAGMTLEAWVRPSAATDWRSVIFKESAGGLSYGLYANNDADVPDARVNAGGDVGAPGTSELAPGEWTHLAATYDGTTLRLFVNGAQAGTHAVEGEIAPGTGPLTFGANNVWGERFRGLIDEVRVYNRPLSTADISADMARPVVAGTPAPPSDTSAGAIGRFGAPAAWPIVPVTMALTSDGQVAAWDGFEAALDSERRWNPATEAFQQIASGRNLFCGGQITLGDGRLLVVGGHVNAYEGLKDTNLFNPSTGTWTRGPDMSQARWYPTVTQLPDGRAFVVSGDTVTLKEPNQSVPLTDASNTVPEIYNPATNQWTALPSASRRMPLYPFMFVLPNGKLFDAGPDTTTRTFDLQTNQWQTVGNSQIDGHSAVMYRPGKILKSGTWSDPEFPDRNVTNRAVAIDMTAASPAWREAASMEYPRSYHTLTVLPDGKVLATGGQTTTDGVDERTGVLASEIWDPDTDKWTTLASHRRPRVYHSSALLLPDGRVLLAGGGAFGNAKNEKSAEIYSPPYLFKGPRPTITDAPETLGLDETISVDTPDAARIRSVSLVRMGSVTHNFDQDQRFIPLQFTAQSDHVRVTGPANANIAPPGRYMVFLVDDQGVPSVAHTVRVTSGDTTPPSAPGSLTATGQTLRAQLNWTASTDNVGVKEYRVHRSTAAGFTPSASNRIATVTAATSYTDSNLAAGTYYYRVVAADAAGNTSPSSNEATAVVAADTTGPTVSLTAPAAGDVVSGNRTISATASDNVAVQSVQFQVDGTNVGAADTTSPYSVTWNTTTVPDGTHTLRAIARDTSGNTTTSATRTVSVDNTGYISGYGFEETSGTTAVDSVNAFNGTISGATRTTSGRFGQALSYDGLNDVVTVPHTSRHNLTGGMTIEAWVRPTTLTSWRSIVMKERSSALAYGLWANNNLDRPTARIFTSSDTATSGTAKLPLNTWSHLTMTWSQSTLRLYVNGSQVSSRSTSGSLATGTGALRFGGNAFAVEFFNGLIDEIRVYRRALSASAISTDMNRAVDP